MVKIQANLKDCISQGSKTDYSKLSTMLNSNMDVVEPDTEKIIPIKKTQQTKYLVDDKPKYNFSFRKQVNEMKQ
eukprot:CAMPEP_0118704236 /NCGR_PEP_ID=MMETSP0800-20121206/19100_1 /TAXON_ID=210618 ORGANISM="Striatella unipunctata, Strain CCMP2910" /NCGR_SAMPLE_ID=MMETSP0800 /ASSEMBLY_ACC=CAM_ASM_000638 /LENGTH=73 /DNA_ID=CAMNT_0006606057 /DNA_START=109 /DNA_END=327 /DNA_ORIENTATION=+